MARLLGLLFLGLMQDLLVHGDVIVTMAGNDKRALPAAKKVLLEVKTCIEATVYIGHTDSFANSYTYRIRLLQTNETAVEFRLEYCLYTSTCYFYTTAAAVDNMCYGFVPIWFEFRKNRKVHVGHGCVLDENVLHKIDSQGDTDVSPLKLTSEGEATWRYGDSACQPETTTTTTTPTTTTTTTQPPTTTVTTPASTTEVSTVTVTTEGISMNGKVKPTTRDPRSCSACATHHLVLWAVVLGISYVIA